MAYTKVAKPTGSSYTNVRNGYPLYDDVTVSYDDSSTFYDGDSPLIYTNIAKPSGLIWNNANFTWASATLTWNNLVGYTNITKPT